MTMKALSRSSYPRLGIGCRVRNLENGDTMLLLPEGVPEHGLPSVSATREAALIAIRDLVVPGLAELGIDAEPTRAWVSGVSPEMESLPA